MKNILYFIALLLFSSVAAQKKTPEEYISEYAPLAQKEMKRSGVPASITLAQGILESESGNSDLSTRSNNHFGIKCKSTWQGEKVYHNDDARGECFRKYTTVEESYIDHSDFLRSNPRYASLFSLEKTDYKGWAKGLKAAGYATNPQYAYKLIDIIEKYTLHSFDPVQQDEKRSIEAEVIKETQENQFDKKEQDENNTESVNNGSENGLDYNKVIYINQTKAIKVASGTSLLALAIQHSLSLDKLLEFNDFEKSKSDIVEKDMLVFLQRKRKEGAVSYHTIKEKESIHDIAQMEGIRLESLLSFNNMSKEQILKVGEKLYLKNKIASK